MNYATDVSPIVVDLETAPLANAREYIDPPDLADIQAPSNYVKPEAIASYIEKEKAKRFADFETDCTRKAALDFNAARIVALGYWTEQAGVDWWTADSAMPESEAVRVFWLKAKGRTLVGFKIREFDLPMLMQRSRYLGVSYPHLDLGRYARGNGIVDLYDLLTFNDLRADWVVRRTMKSFARRFGIPVTDTIDGKDIPALIAAENWEAVQCHLTSDVALTVELAKRLGVIQVNEVQAQPAEAVVA